VFSLEEGPGQLFKALAVFALREINLTKVYLNNSALPLACPL
jgi:prephenate dehydratase